LLVSTIEIVPPTSEETHSSFLSLVNFASRPAVDENIGDEIAGLVVDDMGHARALGRRRGVAVVGADAHAFGLDADRHFAQHFAALDVHDGHERVVLVGDVDDLAGRIERHQLGIGAGFELARHFQRLGIDDIHDVAVAGSNEELLEVGAEHDAARAPGDLDRLDRLERLAVQHRDRVVLFVRDENRPGGSGDCAEEERCAQHGGEFASVHVYTFGRGVT
jgi:hypothetical protein